MRQRAARFLILVVLSLPVLVHPGTSPATASGPEDRPPMPALGRGVFLIASPLLLDPNFRETVVFLCDYGVEGAMGVIVNRPTTVLLSEVLPDLAVLKGTSHLLFAGGPVQPTGVLMLFRVAQEPPGTRQVMKGVYLGGNLETLDRLVTKPEPTETFRAYAGYAGWGPGQLEFEMAQGSWATVRADPTKIFSQDPSELWSELIESLRGPRVIRLEPAEMGR